MKQFIQSPLFKVICLAWYVSTLLGKLNGLSHVLATDAISNHSSYYSAGFNLGYKSGYVTSIAIWSMAIIMMSVKLISGKPAFSFVKR